MQPHMSEDDCIQSTLMTDGFVLGYRNSQRALKYKIKIRDKLTFDW